MACDGFASSNEQELSTEIHVAPLQLLEFDIPTRRRDGQYGGTVCHRPVRLSVATRNKCCFSSGVRTLGMTAGRFGRNLTSPASCSHALARFDSQLLKRANVLAPNLSQRRVAEKLDERSQSLLFKLNRAL